MPLWCRDSLRGRLRGEAFRTRKFIPISCMEFDGECYKHLKYASVESLPDGSETLLDSYISTCRRMPENRAYGSIVGETMSWLSYGESLGKVFGIYDFFRGSIRRGSIFGVYSINRYECLVCEHAVYALGGIVCPLYSTFGTAAIAHVLDETEMETCFISGARADSLYEDVLSKKRTNLRRIVVFDQFERGGAYAELGIEVLLFWKIAETMHSPSEILDMLQQGVDTRPRSGDLSTICYTSGTSGMPKGVMLTHRNFITNIDAFFRGGTSSFSYYDVTSEDVYISYLPLAHVMERLCVHTIISRGAAIGFYRGVVKELGKDYMIIRPTFVTGVPRVFNTFRNKILEEVGRLGVLKRAAFYAGLRWKYFLQLFGIYTSFVDRLIFNKVRMGFGGNIKACLSGSAPLSTEVVRFIQASLCCKVFQGYGQTETTGASLVCTRGEKAVDTVGIPYPSNKIKLVGVSDVRDGSFEIRIKGDNVFKGYYKNQRETDASFEDGWFKTGDMGLVEKKRFRIIGRRKEMFKTSQGEYIVPEKIESILQCPEVEDVFVTGVSTADFVVALVVCVTGLDDSVVVGAVQTAAEEAVADKRMMRFEVPRKIKVLREPFTKFGDVITPTGKKRRAILENALKKCVIELYKS